MSAMPAEKLREPEGLYSPPDFSEETLDSIVANLTPEGGRDFARQTMEAVERARSEGDLRPINLVVESWYRTLMFLSRPRFEELWAEAQKAEGPRLTLEDIRERRAHRAR